MSDLISRSALLKEIAEEYDLNYGEILINPKRFYEMVETVPTAYDVEKVVAELEEESDYEPIDYDYCDMSCSGEEYFIATDKAIDIVRKGGVE